jgi:hypothetical protein
MADVIRKLAELFSCLVFNGYFDCIDVSSGFVSCPGHEIKYFLAC